MKILNYIILILISLWVFSSYIFQESLGVYSTQVYHSAILISAGIAFIVGVGGVFYEDRAKFLKHLKLLLANKALQTLILAVVLGLIINPIFFFFGGMVILIQKDTDTSLIRVVRKLNLIYIIPILVVLTGIIIPSSGLSSATVDQRVGGFNNIIISSATTIADTFGTDTTQYNIGDWVNSLNLNPDHRSFVGKLVSLEGFLFEPDPTQFENYFMISRFVVRCCAADATPIGLPVLYNWRDQNLQRDTWYRVDGAFEYNNEDGILFISPTKIEEIAPLRNPYVN